jgi:hypothetical protein
MSKFLTKAQIWVYTFILASLVYPAGLISLPTPALASSYNLIEPKLVNLAEGEKEKPFVPVELVDERTENSKTIQTGTNTFSLDSSIGVIHYKDDYNSTTEGWKNINLTPVAGKTSTEMVVTKAPYELTIDGLDLKVKDKKTGSITTLKLTDIGTSVTGSTAVTTPVLTFVNGKATAKDIFTDTDLEISWSDYQIRYTRILKSADAPTLAKFNITQMGTGITISTKAVDSKVADDKSVTVVSSIKDGVLTESINTTNISLTYPVRIDPTLDFQVSSSTDDCSIYMAGTDWYLSVLTTEEKLGKTDNSNYKRGVGVRFNSVTVPQGATITTSTLQFGGSGSAGTPSLRIVGDLESDAATFSTLADFQSRRGTDAGGANNNLRTTSYVSWSPSGWSFSWPLTWYTSPEIKTVIKEIVDQATWSSGNDLALFIDDCANQSPSGSHYVQTILQNWSGSSYAIKLHIEYSVPALTVTSQAATSVTNTTATYNGNVTVLASANVTLRGFAWGTTSNTTNPGTQAPPTASYSSNYTVSGSWGIGAFTNSTTGLSRGTSYYYRAYAKDGTTWAWGDQITVLTLPGEATSVSATDGTYTANVTITWTKATGATGYKVYEGANLLSTLGDVAIYSDTAAGAPTITSGTSSCTNTSAYVTLGVTGESASNGASRTYKVVSLNGTGDGNPSATDTGYRGTTTLTYQWNRSAADSNAGYSVIAGGTTDPYNDTGAPAPLITAGASVASDGTSTAHVSLSLSGTSVADGSYRYFQCTISMSGATSSNTTVSRGYRPLTALTYQWNRSAADSDASYSTIGGATASTYNDTGAPAPTITGGTTTATDGTSTTQVTLSIASETANNGDGRYYTCTLVSTGASNTPATATANRGYRSVGALTYQWYISEADSDASYTDVSGGTTDPYNDTTYAPAPTITKGTSSATDGTSAAYVTLSNAGEAAVDGLGRYYKCLLTATGAANAYSSANRGYRGTTTLTYAWQRSAADSDASYGAIGGGTTDPYNDTGAPADGTGRYYKVIISMTGASSQTTTADRGYREAHDITNSPDTKAFNVIQESGSFYAKGSAPSNPVTDGECTYTITNTGSVPIDISITGFNYTGGVGWTLGASVGANTVKMTAYASGTNPASGVVLTTGSQLFLSNLAAAATKKWDFRLDTGTFTDGAAKTGKITLTSTVH